MGIERVPLGDEQWADLDADRLTIKVRDEYWAAYGSATPLAKPTVVLDADGQIVTRKEALIIDGKVQSTPSGDPVLVDQPVVDPGEPSGAWLRRESAGWNVMLAHMIVAWSFEDRPPPNGDVKAIEALPADVGNRLQAWCLHNRSGLMPDFSLTKESFDDAGSPIEP